MKTFQQFITEGRDAPLYHGTSVADAVEIINTDEMEARTPQVHMGLFPQKPKHVVKGISLSRNHRVASQFGPVVFEFDQRKLVHRHKIIPFQFADSEIAGYPKAIAARSTEGSVTGAYSAESEEFVIGPIRDVDKYITAIHVHYLVFKNMRSSFSDPIRTHPKLNVWGRDADD